MTSVDLPEEENPFLGVRGIRLSLDKQELFETQIESILISQSVDRVKIMFPMISTIEDFLESNQIVEFTREIKKNPMEFINNFARQNAALKRLPTAREVAEVLSLIHI